jgi:hypothetical protein
MSQKMILFITIAVKTSNPTNESRSASYIFLLIACCSPICEPGYHRRYNAGYELDDWSSITGRGIGSGAHPDSYPVGLFPQG